MLRVIARPKPGISPSQATARLKTLAPEIYKATAPAHWGAEDRGEYLRRTLEARPVGKGISFVREQYSQALTILMAIAGVVLLIACANVANLLLARNAARQREIAIRMALGSGRARLIRQLLTESLLLSGSGALLGCLFAQWITRLLAGFLDVFLDLTPDLRVLAFTSGAAVLTALLFGIAPAWRGTRVQPQDAMKANARGIVEGSRFGPGKVLVMLQFALSLLLVVGAGLMLSTVWRFTSLDPGFERSHVLLAGVDLRNGRYSPERRVAVFRELLTKMRSIPGVRSASLSDVTPICGCNPTCELIVEGYSAKSSAEITVRRNRIGDRYFATLGTAFTAGRDFNERDTPASPEVAIVNQAMAKQYFGGESPLDGIIAFRRAANWVSRWRSSAS